MRDLDIIFYDLSEKCQVLYMYTNNQGWLSAIIKVSFELYKNIKENCSRVFIGYQSCKAYDIINARPCFNYGRFGLNGVQCNNDSVRLKCARRSKIRQCNNTLIQWANCIYHNKGFKNLIWYM